MKPKRRTRSASARSADAGALELAPLDRGEEGVRVLRARERTAARAGEGEGRIGALGDLAEARVHHPIVESIHDPTAELRDRAHALGGVEPEQLDGRVRILLVRLDRDERLGVVGHLRVLAHARLARRGDAREALANRGLHRLRVEVADGDDGHQVGAVPVAIEGTCQGVGEALEVLARADRKARGVLRALEEHGELLVEQPHLRAASGAPLLDHHAALLADLGRVERQTRRPVLQDVERGVDDRGGVGGDPQHVHRLVERRVRVEIRAELHADALEEVDEARLREAARAVERHVLDEVRHAELPVALEDRARVDGETKLGAILGLGVATHEIVNPVRQRAAQHGRVEGEGRVGRKRSRDRGRGGPRRLRAARRSGSVASAAERSRAVRDVSDTGREVSGEVRAGDSRQVSIAPRRAQGPIAPSAGTTMARLAPHAQDRTKRANE